MSQMTDYLEQRICNHVLGKSAYAMPTVFLALFTANPGETGSQASEVTGGGYARQPLTAAMGTAGATTGTATNSQALTFGPATADWGTVTHMAIMDAATAGNMLMYAPVAQSKVMNTGDSTQIAVGALSTVFA